MVFPKIIHQTWKNDRVPAALAPYQESWRRLNPDWQYRLWTDADNDALVRDDFPSLFDLYSSLPQAIQRADFARVLYLWRFGGLYVDLDIEALQPADALLARGCWLGREPTLHAERLREVDSVVCNAAMASEPNHPFWERMIEEIRERSKLGIRDPVWTTGPLCLQAAYEAHGRQLGVKAWEPDVFFPVPDLDSRTLRLGRETRRRYQRMIDTGCYPRESIGVHHWAHTWIPMHPLRSTVRKFGTAVEDARAVLRGQVTADELSRPERYGIDFPEDRFPPRRSRKASYLETRDAGCEAAGRSSIAIGVLVYNRIDLVHLLRARLEAIAALFQSARIYILGEDSTDGTEEVILEWCRESPERVRSIAPVATSACGVGRIAALRNVLLEQIEAADPTDYVAMFDGDLEGPISLDGIAHSIALMDDDRGLGAVTAFGINNWVGFDTSLPFLGYTYYDPFAFRERSWDRTRSDRAVRWRLGKLRRGDPPLEVKSAFGGGAIYRASAIRGLRYSLSNEDCEHVEFHRMLAEREGRLCINPSMLLLAGKQGHHDISREDDARANLNARPSRAQDRRELQGKVGP